MNWSVFWFLMTCLFAGAWIGAMRGATSSHRVVIATGTNSLVIVNNGSVTVLPEVEP